jgi:uncharacterized GH25 family protein
VLNVLIAHANSAGVRWVAWVVAASLEAGLLLALIGLAWLAVRDRVALQVGYCLFLLVPLRLLVPVVVTVPTVLVEWTPTALISSWCRAALDSGRVERRPPVETPIAAARPEPRVTPPSRSEAVVADAHALTSPVDPRSGRPFATTVRASAQSVFETPRLTLPAMAMMSWLAAVVFLLARFTGTQRQFRARLRSALPVDESKSAVDLRELCRLAGVPQTIRILECEGIAAPSVWGIARPTILLPRGIASSLTAAQLRWVLLHELAHVRRRDLIVVTLQRFASVLHFFNPAVWIANRIIHQLREYACDDLALSLSQTSAVESGEAFVRILRHADRSRRGLEGAIGIFGLDSRACCLRRVRRLLDTDRPIRTAPGALWTGALILLAIVTVPRLRAADDAPQAVPQEPSAARNQVGPKVATENGPAGEAREFELRVVGPGGRPVPGAEVELGPDLVSTAKQVRQGTLVRQRLHRTIVATDAEGRLVIELPHEPDRFNLYITIPGYGPYWAGWRSDSYKEPVPTRFTAELEPAWSLGGIVVDGDGKAVEGAIVWPSIEFKRRPGETQQPYTGTRLKTDARGEWHFDSVPASMTEVHVAIDHPKYMPVRQVLTRSGYGLEGGRGPAGRIVLERGVTVSGKVTDESGKPIAGARVRTKYWNVIREAETGPDGDYRLIGCEPRAVRIVASAKGRATDMKELNIDPDMGPVDFAMKPGGTVRVRVLDEQGKPVPRATIFFQRWRGPISYFEFDHVSRYTDENGVWVWHEAPSDELKADIGRPGVMQLPLQTLMAREEEYVFRVPGALVVSGKVVDAETREPIKAFQVVPGRRDDQGRMSWNRREGFTAADGHYEIRETLGDSAHLVRIEADGYQAAVSREIKSSEGTISIDFALKRGKNIVAKVVTPRALPAAGAKVALGIAGSQINVKNGDIDNQSTFCERVETDDAGRFHFPGQDADFQLVITHPSGFAHLQSTPDWDRARIIRLEPWARVEGTFRVGKTPAANVPIELDAPGLSSYGNDVPSIFTRHEAITGPGGRFVFERVLPGKGRIGRSITVMVNEGATEVTSTGMVAAEFPAGKTTHIDLGGTGRAVVGTLRPPAGFEGQVRWNFAMVEVMPGKLEKQAAGPSLAYLRASVDRDGRFWIDDVPAGDYSLGVWFQRDEPGRLRNHRFKVPPPEGELAGKPVDLGILRLEKR